MHSYHLIPVKNKPEWFQVDRVFYFQLGKSKKNEAFIESNYKSIKSIAEESNLNFIFHKYIFEHKIDLSDSVPDVEFLRKIGAMSGDSFYDELAYQIFDYDVIDPIYLVRRFNEFFLIGWVYDRQSPDKFPYHAFRPLDDIVIGENVKFKASLGPKAERLGGITHPEAHPDLFFNAEYQCDECHYSGKVYISNVYDLFDIYSVDEKCSVCGEETETCDGVLIYRTDWPDPDEEPWQLQCAYLPDGRGYCKLCEVNHKLDYRSVTPSCPKCDGTMKYKSTLKV